MVCSNSEREFLSFFFASFNGGPSELEKRGARGTHLSSPPPMPPIAATGPPTDSHHSGNMSRARDASLLLLPMPTLRRAPLLPLPPPAPPPTLLPPRCQQKRVYFCAHAEGAPQLPVPPPAPPLIAIVATDSAATSLSAKTCHVCATRLCYYSHANAPPLLSHLYREALP
jgi:hypothetical protein